jgi:hypothetical protein
LRTYCASSNDVCSIAIGDPNHVQFCGQHLMQHDSSDDAQLCGFHLILRCGLQDGLQFSNGAKGKSRVSMGAYFHSPSIVFQVSGFLLIAMLTVAGGCSWSWMWLASDSSTPPQPRMMSKTNSGCSIIWCRLTVLLFVLMASPAIAGSVSASGRNNNGQLGDGTTTPHRSTLVQVAVGVADVVGVSAGEAHTLLLTSAGTVYASGYNNHGQLGDGTTTDRHTPVRVATGVADVVQVAAEIYHSLFLTSAGIVYAAGSNKTIMASWAMAQTQTGTHQCRWQQGWQMWWRFLLDNTTPYS